MVGCVKEGGSNVIDTKGNACRVGKVHIKKTASCAAVVTCYTELNVTPNSESVAGLLSSDLSSFINHNFRSTI